MDTRKTIRSVGLRAAETQGVTLTPTIVADFMKKLVYSIHGGFVGHELRRELLKIVMNVDGKASIDTLFR
jgi:AICAR transformylase/IMP cyclohydrolase PurH